MGNHLRYIVDKALDQGSLLREEIVELLRIEDEGDMEYLFKNARESRRRKFGDKIFLYGFVYFSNFCRNNCSFCYSRRENSIERYRKTVEEIREIAGRLKDSGVNLIDLTMGEDPYYHSGDFREVLEAVVETKKAAGLPLMISPGVVGRELLDDFAEAGVDWYALYQETHNKSLFKGLRTGQSYDERMDIKVYAKKKGMLVEEGLLTGVGENHEDIADSIIEMKKLEADQVRVMTFVPQEGVPLRKSTMADSYLEHKTIAVMRLLCSDSLIPASLDIEGIKGLKTRLDSGANVITSIILPREGLSGVAQNSMDIDDGARSVERVKFVLRKLGLRVGTEKEYKEYIDKRRFHHV